MNDMLNKLPEFLLIIGVVIMIINWVIPDDKEYEIEVQLFPCLVKNNFDSVELKVPYTILINEIIKYTGPILTANKIKTYPHFRIRYYEHKKQMGVFYSGSSEIGIYLKNHKTLLSLVDTVLHEVAHFIQQKADGKEYKKYNNYTNQFGYYDNPLEIEARAFAKKHRKDCLRHLETLQIIKR